MKKVLSLAVALVATVMLSSSVWAANNFTATVSFADIHGQVTLEAVLKKVSDNTTITSGSFGWDNVDETFVGNPGPYNFKVANAYVQMTKTITQAGGAAYLFQDNKSTSGTVDYVAVNPRHEGEQGEIEVYSGLVRGGSQGGENGYVAMTFRPSKEIVADPSTMNFQPEKPGVVPPTTDNPDGKDYVVKWFLDQSNSNFGTADNLTYRTIANENGYVGLDNTKTTATAYMYFAGNFVGVAGETTYGTNHIIFKTSVE